MGALRDLLAEAQWAGAVRDEIDAPEVGVSSWVAWRQLMPKSATVSSPSCAEDWLTRTRGGGGRGRARRA